MIEAQLSMLPHPYLQQEGSPWSEGRILSRAMERKELEHMHCMQETPSSISITQNSPGSAWCDSVEVQHHWVPALNIQTCRVNLSVA